MKKKTIRREDLGIARARVFLRICDLKIKVVLSAMPMSLLAGREREGTDARKAASTWRWKLDTRFISWSDCDFRRGFKYWKYRAAAFNLPRDPIGFYKHGKSAREYTRRRPPRRRRRMLILGISLSRKSVILLSCFKMAMSWKILFSPSPREFK